MPPPATTCAGRPEVAIPSLVIRRADTHFDTAIITEKVTTCLGRAAEIRIGGTAPGLPMRYSERMADTVSGILSVLD